MGFSGFLKETPVCKKKNAPQKYPKIPGQGPKISAKPALSSFFFFFFVDPLKCFQFCELKVFESNFFQFFFKGDMF